MAKVVFGSPVKDEENKARRFTHLEFLTAIGDSAVLQIMSSTDPVIKLIDRKFQAASFIDLGHPDTVAGLVYLRDSDQVPAFGADEHAAIVGA